MALWPCYTMRMSAFGLPVKFTPMALRVCHLFWWGRNANEIANELQITTSQVQSILGSAPAREILELMKRNVINSMLEVSSAIQAIAPAILEEKVKLALGSDDERVRDRACNDLLQWAIGTPTKKVLVVNESSHEGETESEDEIRERLLKTVGIVKSDLDPGRILN